MECLGTPVGTSSRFQLKPRASKISKFLAVCIDAVQRL